MKRKAPKGLIVLTEQEGGKRYVQIDLLAMAKEPEAIEDYLDGLIAETRRHEPTMSHEAVVRSVQKRFKRK
jgi:hypothetical protein